MKQILCLFLFALLFVVAFSETSAPETITLTEDSSADEATRSRVGGDGVSTSRSRIRALEMKTLDLEKTLEELDFEQD
jgi:TolA-binding protein